MQVLEQLPVFYAAIGYSAVYMLGGGGIVGALGIYVVAKMLGK